MTREELIQSKEYWIAKLQIDLFNEVEDYMQKNKLNRTQFADKLGVSKGYISQILNGEADHRMSKFIELALSIGLVPTVSYEKPEELIQREQAGYYDITLSDIERSKTVLAQSGYLYSHKPVKICMNSLDTSETNPNWTELSAKQEKNSYSLVS